MEIIPSNRGFGYWLFEIYNPNKTIGPFKGFLFINKDHHIIFEDSSLKVTILNIPSQNVSWVELKNGL